MAQEKNVSEATKVSPNVQEELDRIALETAEINRQLATASLEMKKQELEDLKIRNEEVRQKREFARQRQINAMESDKRRKEDMQRKQAFCNHTQGGEGLEGLYQGDGVQSTYQRETDVIGQESFRCIRCEHRVRQSDNADEFKRIKKLPHKGLVGPVPVLFKYVDGAGNTVTTPAIIIPE
jgi:hypothetical protein